MTIEMLVKYLRAKIESCASLEKIFAERQDYVLASQYHEARRTYQDVLTMIENPSLCDSILKIMGVKND